MVFLFLFYLVQYSIIFFFNCALVGAAMIRLDGGDPTVHDGLRVASSRIVQIMGFVFFLFYLAACGIGMVFIFVAAQTGNPVLIVPVIALVVLAFIGLALVQAALQGVYSAALYRYATEGNAGEAFPSSLLGEAFRPKR